jgi:transcriptional regulator with XRE-family HTH domain
MSRIARVLVIAILATCGNLSHAQPEEEATRVAREAFADGMTSFRLGQWHSAIESWQRGYRAKPDPGFLYNIAQAHRLASEPERALFFYRSFLNADPSSPSRSEVLERVAQLEKLVAAEESARRAAPAEPHPAPASAVVATRGPAPSPALRGDLALTAGVALWTEGLDAPASPSLGLTLSGGYTVIGRPRVELRVGALAGYSYLRDRSSTDHFIGVLADPLLRVRLWRERLYGFVEVGLGVQIVAGLASDSALLASGARPRTLVAFALRPALGIELRLTSRVALFASPSLWYSPAPDAILVRRSLLRADVALGVSVRCERTVIESTLRSNRSSVGSPALPFSPHEGHKAQNRKIHF